MPLIRYLAPVLAVGLAACTSPRSPDANANAGTVPVPAAPVSLAIMGDWPYNKVLSEHADDLVASVNARRPDWVVHLGDIHDGAMPCTSAGIRPPLASSDPGWNQFVYNVFQRFETAVVYTPGDNEWTDCHKAKAGRSGHPLLELAALRQLFFARPGHTLGGVDVRVETQAQHHDPAFPADAQFVENVRWLAAGTVFVTVHMTGSNNDSVPWTGAFADPVAQARERSERTAAGIRWLEAAFREAVTHDARAVVILQQADMWDPVALREDGLDQYRPYVLALAAQASRFGGKVLVVNGDSHLYGSDRPLADPASGTGRIHGTEAVPNLTRITVQGSTNAPASWLRLVVDPATPDVFSWETVAWCRDPSLTCP